MLLLDRVLPFKKFNVCTFVGLIILVLSAKAFFNQEQVKGLMAGYLFCWGNLSALAYLGALLVSSLSGNNKQLSKHLKGFAMMLGFVKFFLFIVILFVLVSVLKLSPMFLFAGAFIALSIMAGVMSYFYMRYIKELAVQREKEHEAIRMQRLANEKSQTRAKSSPKSASHYIGKQPVGVPYI